MNETTHSPLPWTVFLNGDVCDVTGAVVARIVYPELRPGRDPDPAYVVCNANAKLVIRAVNSHDELLAACKEALEWLVAMKEVLVVPDDQLPESYRAFVRQLQQTIAQAENKS